MKDGIIKMSKDKDKNIALADHNPELVPEWSERNELFTPYDVTYGSNKKVWWKGSCGHEWMASVKDRTSGMGCPYCAGKRVLVGFNDLATSCPKLVKEWSDKNAELSPKDVTSNSHKKAWWKGACGHEWEAIIKNRVNGSDCPFCSGNQFLKGFNDLLSKCPEVAVEWSDKNGDLRPDMVLPNSNQSVWWKCKKHGHEWKARIADRYRGSGCPYCSGALLLAGFNDLATTNPELITEWSEKNTISTQMIKASSSRRVWWECKVCHFIWQAAPRDRCRGNQCPVCSKGYVMKGVNDLTTTHPEIAKYWNHLKNGRLQPEDFTRYSARPVWWMGDCGHEWREKILDMVNSNGICLVCEKEFEKQFGQRAIRYYFERNRYEVYMDDDQEIGLSLDLYIPELHVAIMLSDHQKLTKHGYQQDMIINQLCRKADILLIRVLDRQEKEFEDCVTLRRLDDSMESFEDALCQIFQLFHLTCDVDLESDYEEIWNEFEQERRKNITNSLARIKTVLKVHKKDF